MTAPTETTTPETPAVPEIPEHETDYKVNKTRKGISEPVVLNTHDTTLNAIVDREGLILASAQSDGLNMLTAQARANFGAKKGRYYFEAYILSGGGKSNDLKVGVSTSSATWLGGKGSICFDRETLIKADGEAVAPKHTKQNVSKKDVIGILLNLEEKHKNKNTISLFINGKRICEPVDIPASMHKQALFPHIAAINLTVGVNFGTPQCALPFTTLTFNELGSLENEKTKIVAPKNPKVLFSVGTPSDESMTKFLAKKENESFLGLTAAYLDEWIAESGIAKRNEEFYGIGVCDNPYLLAPWLRSRPRNVLFAQGGLLLPGERKQKVGQFNGFEIGALILPIGKQKHVYSNYADACFPTQEEGFSTVAFLDVKESEAKKQLEEYRKDQKLRSKVEDLKVGEYFTERHAEWTKFVTEKKLTEEGKAFSDEDWMLANIRAELVHLLHSFKDDVADDERPSFPPVLAQHYYATYLEKKHLNTMLYACRDVEELVREHLTDCITISEETGLLNVTVDKDIELEKIFTLVDNERDARETRVGAGDELSELKFSAKNPPRQHHHNNHHGGKGKGYKGNRNDKRGMQHLPQSQSQRQRTN